MFEHIFTSCLRKVKAAMSNHRSGWLLSNALDVKGVYFLLPSVEIQTSGRKRGVIHTRQTRRPCSVF